MTVKTLLPYGGITASQIASRSTTGFSSINLVGSTVQVPNIKLSGIRSVLGASSSRLKALCQSSLVNKWSGFSPRYWLLVSGVISDVLRANYMMSHFAGYNHQAPAPYFVGHTADGIIYEGQSSTWLGASLFLSEIAWMDIPFLMSINMEITINSSVAAVQHIALNVSDYLVTQHIFNEEVSTVGWMSDRSATLRFYFGRDASNGWQELASVPGLSNQTVNWTMVYKAVLRSFRISDTLQSTLGGSAVIIRTSGDLANCYVSQLTGGYGSVTLSLHGIDTNGDGVGDLDVVQADRAVWFKKNNGLWAYMSAITLHVDDSAGGTFTTVFSIVAPYIMLTYSDYVDIEIR